MIKQKILVIICVILVVSISGVTFVAKMDGGGILNLWKTVVDFFTFIPEPQWNLITLILAIIPIIYGVSKIIRSRRIKLREERDRLKEKKFPYHLVDVEKLPIENEIKSALDGNIEPYVESEKVKKEIGEDLIPKSGRVIIYGPHGVGKTREAIEILQRLNWLKSRNIYFKNGEIEIPSGSPPKQQNMTLFIDNLTHPEILFNERGIEMRSQTLSETLRAVIVLFEKFEDIPIIITVNPKMSKKIKRELSDIIKNYNFTKLELEGFSQYEKEQYIRNVADMLGFEPLGDVILKSIVKMSDVSLEKIYTFFTNLKKEAKTCIDEEDIKRFKDFSKGRWKEEYEKLSGDEKIIFQALSKLKQFSIPTFLYLVAELCLSIKGIKFFKLPRRRKFLKIIAKMEENDLFKIESSEVHVHDSKCFFGDTKKIKSDFQLIDNVVDFISKKRKYKYDLYHLLTPFAEKLHKKYDMHGESNRILDRMLALPDTFFPQNPEKVRSKILFYKGYNNYSLGKKYWKNAENCYKQAIKLDELNLFAKHALATHRHKKGDLSGALKLLDEIIVANRSDILAHKTKLDIYIDIGINTENIEKAKEIYEDIGELIRGDIPNEVSLSSELSCIRFLAEIGKFLQSEGELEEAEKQFQEVEQKFEELISKTPPDEYELKAIILNVYGCFLDGILRKREEGIAQLEKAHKVWPKHLHTLHKLVTIYIKEGEEKTEEKSRYWKKARDYLDKLLKIDSNHYPGLRSLAELEGRYIEWEKISEAEIWKKLIDICDKYQKAMEPEADYPSLHNSIVHNSIGQFLWNVEMKTKITIANNNLSIPSPKAEFIKSIEIKKYFNDTKSVPLKIRKHLMIAYCSFVSYLIKTGHVRNDSIMIEEGHFYGNKLIELCEETGEITFHSNNSYMESYIGKHLLDKGELNKAEKRFERALKLNIKNAQAWRWLKEIHEKKEEHIEAIKCFRNYAMLRNNLKLHDEVRSTTERWMREGKIPQDIEPLINHSNIIYELGSNGDLAPRYIFGPAYNLYKMGKERRDKSMLREAKDQFIQGYTRSMDKNDKELARKNLWFAGECQEILAEQVDSETLKYYIESVVLDGLSPDYAKLESKIEDYTYSAASKRKNGDVLLYLEKVRLIEDTHILSSLMKCYAAIGKMEKAEEVCQKLYFLFKNEESKRKLRRIASNLGLRCP